MNLTHSAQQVMAAHHILTPPWEDCALIYSTVYRTCHMCQSYWNAATTSRNKPRLICIHTWEFMYFSTLIVLWQYIPIPWQLNLQMHVTAHSAHSFDRVAWCQASTVRVIISGVEKIWVAALFPDILKYLKIKIKVFLLKVHLNEILDVRFVS